MVLNLRHKGVFLEVVTYFLFIFGVLVFFGAGVGGHSRRNECKRMADDFWRIFPMLETWLGCSSSSRHLLLVFYIFCSW